MTLSPPILLPKNYTPSPSLTTSQTILLPSGSSLYTYTLMSSSNPIKIDYGSVISCMCSTGLGTFLGFESGLLSLSKNSWLGRRDQTLHTSGTRITSVQVLGNYVVFSDEDSLKILSISTLTRLASVARPSGANPDLHPKQFRESVKPFYAFLNVRCLFVGWGDCVMILRIEGGEGGEKVKCSKVRQGERRERLTTRTDEMTTRIDEMTTSGDVNSNSELRELVTPCRLLV